MQRIPQTAFVLGAGLGTRLRPLTAHCPKPLIPVCHKPLITFAFDHLLSIEIRRLIVNTHHCAEKYAEVFPNSVYRNIPITFRHEPVLLETAGGIKNIADLLHQEPLLIYNGDILTDLPLKKLLDAHAGSQSEVTMVLRSNGGEKRVAFDLASQQIKDLRGLCKSMLPPDYAFAGIYMIQPEFLQRIPAGEKLSIIPVLVEMIRSGVPVGGVVIDEGDWWDLGTVAEYEAMQARIWNGWTPSFPTYYDKDARFHNTEYQLKQRLGYCDIALEALEKGGSDRRFYRLTERESGQTKIVLNYIPEQAEENTIYLRVAKFLKQIGVQVPDVIQHESCARLVLMQDLGTQDLWSFRNRDWDTRRRLYGLALREAAKLHARGMQAYERNPFSLYPPFDEAMYRWEREYFIDNCLGRHFGLPEKILESLREDSDLLQLASDLANLPRCLLQRDFQSQNVMIYNDHAYLIDFQGMRAGVHAYDVASLLYDPYVELTEEERFILRRDYEHFANEEGLFLGSDFADLFDRCVIHRLMQALGAYGFLGLTKGKPQFLEFIPVALRSLQIVVRRTNLFPGLDRVIANLLS